MNIHDLIICKTKVEAVVHGGEVWIPLRRMCDNLGLHLEAQQTRVKDDPRFSFRVIRTVAADGKMREMFCLPKEQIHGWLFTINPNKVKASARKTLLAYQREIMRVLDHYFDEGFACYDPDFEELFCKVIQIFQNTRYERFLRNFEVETGRNLKLPSGKYT